MKILPVSQLKKRSVRCCDQKDFGILPPPPPTPLQEKFSGFPRAKAPTANFKKTPHQTLSSFRPIWRPVRVEEYI